MVSSSADEEMEVVNEESRLWLTASGEDSVNPTADDPRVLLPASVEKTGMLISVARDP